MIRSGRLGSGRSVILAVALIGLSGCGVFKGAPKKTPTVGNRVPILVSESDISADKTIADVQVTLPEPLVNPDWAQPGGNPAKALGHVALGQRPAQLWRARVTGGSSRERLAAAPVMADGKVFVTDTAAIVHAFDANTGASLWSTQLSDQKKTRAARFGGGASFNEGRVFATDGVGDVVALNAADGKEIWRARPGGPLRGSPTVAEGSVFVLSQDNQIFSLDEGNGQVQWVKGATLENQGVFGVGAPAVSQGSIVAGFSSGELNAYRYENGLSLWQDALSRASISTSVSSLADIDASPVIDGGRVYAVGQGGRMVALELATGQRLWEQSFAGISTPWVAGEWVFVVTDDARLVCLARSTGKARWIAQLPRYRNEKKRSGAITWYGPVLAGGRLVLTNSRGQIAFANPGDGTLTDPVAAGAPFSLPPIVANSTLYTLDQAGSLTAWR